MTKRPDDDELARYVESIKHFPQLTDVEQSRLMERIAATRDAQRERRDGATSPARRKELDSILQDGATARELLVASHRRLVVSIAFKYRTAADLPVMELVRAGNGGLDHAAERYDPARGFTFKSYATWWVRQAITRRVCGTSS